MVVVVLLGVMGSLDAVMEALSVDSFGKPQFWFAHGGGDRAQRGDQLEYRPLPGGHDGDGGGDERGRVLRLALPALAKSLGFRPMPLLLSFMAVAALLSMFVDSITVVLFLVVATVRLARLLRIDPVPMIIGEIFAANLGGRGHHDRGPAQHHPGHLPGAGVLGLSSEQRPHLPGGVWGGAGLLLPVLSQQAPGRGVERGPGPLGHGPATPSPTAGPLASM